MTHITFEEIVQAVHKLTPEQKAALIQSLQPEVADDDAGLTREQALAELDALRAIGAFNNVESLYGKYARPGTEVTDEELNAYLHAIATEWEQELDDLIDND